MYRTLLPAALTLALAGPVLAAPAAPTAPAAPAAAKPAFSSNSTFADIYANKAATAALAKAIPDFPGPPEEFRDVVMTMTPRAVQEFAGDIFTDAALKRLDEELAKIPAGDAAPAAGANPAQAAPAAQPATPPAQGPAAAPTAPRAGQ